MVVIETNLWKLGHYNAGFRSSRAKILFESSPSGFSRL